MKKNIYTDGSYFKNNPTWNAEDSAWKAGLIYDIVTKNIGAVKEVTEVGCGTGEILASLSRKDTNIEKLSGYYISPQAIPISKEHSAKFWGGYSLMIIAK